MDAADDRSKAVASGDTAAGGGGGERATSFGRVAEQYESFRPGPPAAAVRWLFPERVDTVVDLGAGTGALARLLGDVAHNVVAVEPDPDMRRLLADRPGLDVREGRGEALPLPDASADGVVASSSWHWVDPVAGLREASRVLRPGGLMAAMWTGPDPDGAFMRQAQAALAQGGGDEVLAGTVDGTFSPERLQLLIPDGLPFATPEHQRFTWVLPLTADQLIGLLGTMSWIIVMAPAQREHLFSMARRLLRDFLGVEGEVTADVDFTSDVYRSYLRDHGADRAG